jgi:hypothetical protein
MTIDLSQLAEHRLGVTPPNGVKPHHRKNWLAVRPDRNEAGLVP